MRYKKTLIYFFVAILITSLTSTSSYALFTSGINFSNYDFNNVDIKNGNLNLVLNGNDQNWNSIVNGIPSPLVTANNKSTYSVSTKEDGPLVEYGPIKIGLNNSDINSKLNLKLDFALGQSDEYTNKAKAFEVIVGDIDNFGFGFGSVDPFAGQLTTNHSMDVYPTSYDAMGTDRRMSPSGFYNVMESYLGSDIIGKASGASIINTNIQSYASGWVIGHNKSGSFYNMKLNKELPAFSDGTVLPALTPIMFDGYTDRGLYGTNGVGDNQSNDYLMDNKNWKYIQSVEPITFKYDAGEGRIESAVFQLFIDDLQPGKSDSKMLLSTFVGNSSSEFKVYLSVVGSGKKIEVEEFSNIINSFNQSGPVGNMISLNLPIKYLSYIRDASGLDKGLQLIIDDNRIGTSGDSYCIDFAKLTVNSPVAINKTITLKGYVKDEQSGLGIKGVTVTSGDGFSTITDSNGYYEFNVSPGIINLSLSKEGYKDYYYNSPDNLTVNTTITDLKMNGYYEKGKVQVNLIIKEYCDGAYNSNTNTIIGLTEEEQKYINTIEESTTSDVKTTKIIYKPITYIGTSISAVYNGLNMKPNSRVEVYYSLKFSSQSEMEIYKKYNLDFTSKISVKATQENNPNWNEDGTGEGYIPSYIPGNISRTIDTSLENESIETSKIYFEIPTTVGYWNSAVNPVFNVTDSTTGLYKKLDNSNISKNNNWFIYDSKNYDSIGSKFKIKIEDGSNSTKNSGDLYYFNTKKIFVCTN